MVQMKYSAKRKQERYVAKSNVLIFKWLLLILAIL